MKYALILSGEMRTYRHTIDSIKKFLPDADIYLHTWTTSKGSWKNKHRNISIIEESISDNDIIKCYGSQLKNYILEDMPNIDNWDYNVKLPYGWKKRKRNIIDIHYQIYKAFNLIQDTYDVVVRSRPDVKILKRPELDMPGIHMTRNPGKRMEEKLNDFFAWGDSLSMEVYCSMLEYFDDALKILDSEEILFQNYVEKQGVPIHTKELHGEILRDEHFLEDHRVNYYAT